MRIIEETDNEYAYTQVEYSQECFTFSMNLDCKLASRGHHHCHGTFHLLQRALVFDVTEKRKKKRDGFTGPSLRNTDNITSGHDSWYSLGLNWRRSDVIQFLDHIKAVKTTIRHMKAR